MAEGFVNVTEGSGKKAHTNTRTIGANTVEDEYVISGIPFFASYRARGSSIATTTLDSHLLQIMAGASLNVYVTRIRVYQQALATAAAIVAFDIQRLTTAGTGGTANTPVPLDTTDAASGATAMTLPTVKGTEGAQILDSQAAYFLQTMAASIGVPQGTMVLDSDFRNPYAKPLRIPAGTANGIALKLRTATAGATVTIIAEFFEANN